MAQPTIWRSLPPTASGTYWFYGTRYPGDSCQMRVIEVHRYSRGCGYMSQGMCCEVRQMQGLWLPVEVPPAPILTDSVDAGNSTVQALQPSGEGITHAI